MPILQKERFLHPEGLFDQPPDEEDAEWWAIYTKSRQEKALAREMAQLGTPFFLPLVDQRRLIRGRRTRSFLPLFSGYLFCRAEKTQCYALLGTRRISRILPVPDPRRLQSDLAQIARLMDAEEPLAREQRLEVGTPVRVRYGALKGLEGVLVKRARGDRVLVSVDYLQQGVSISIEDFMIEPA